jgi:DNA replication protein DnaC
MASCNSDCPLCHGEGLIKIGDAYDICPNHPGFYLDANVELSDKDVPGLLPKSRNLSLIGNALKDLRKAGFGMLWLQGDYGIGKTVLARAATVEAVTEFRSAKFYRQMELINWLRSSYSHENGQTELMRRIKEIVSVKWLVIDEIGRVNATDFSNEVMGEIVDTRYRMALKKQAMTVLISNDPPEQVLSAYLVDRIRDVKNKVMVIQGKSLRKGV